MESAAHTPGQRSTNKRKWPEFSNQNNARTMCVMIKDEIDTTIPLIRSNFWLSLGYCQPSLLTADKSQTRASHGALHSLPLGRICPSRARLSKPLSRNFSLLQSLKPSFSSTDFPTSYWIFAVCFKPASY